MTSRVMSRARTTGNPKAKLISPAAPSPGSTVSGLGTISLVASSLDR